MVAISQVRESLAQLTEETIPRTSLFVGGTSGVGKLTLIELVSLNLPVKVYIVGRKATEPAMRPLLEDLRRKNSKAELIWVEGEISLLSETQRICEMIEQKEEKLDFMCLTAGYAPFGGRNNTSEGLDVTHALEYYGRMLFTLLLLPLLRASPSPRVLTVLAGSMLSKRLNVDDLNLEKPGNFGGIQTQGHMAIMNTLFLDRLAADADNENVSFVHNWPGVVDTGNMARYHRPSALSPFPLTALLKPLTWLIKFSDREAGERHVYNATSGTFGGRGPRGGLGVKKGTAGVEGKGLFLLNHKCEASYNEKILGELRAEAQEKILLTLCDVQLLTGTGILLSGFIGLRDYVSTYHWELITYLAWFSNVTHAACISCLRGYFYSSQTERNWRIGFMTVLLVGLVTAIVPTAYFDGAAQPWSNARCFFDSELAEETWRGEDNILVATNGTREDRGDDFRWARSTAAYESHVISIFIVIYSFATRVIKTFRISSDFAKLTLRERLGQAKPSPEMEHLPIPGDPISGHPAIRCATRQFGDPAPFLEYPARHGGLLTGRFPHVPTQEDALRGIFAAAVTDREVIDFFQGWLFFSLLREFLGPVYSHGNYMSAAYDDDDDGKLTFVGLSTRTLHDDLAGLREDGMLSSIRRGDERHRHLEECLETALGALESAEANYPGFFEAYADEVVCLASVAETLDAALQTALAHGPVGEMVPWEQYHPESNKHNWLSRVQSLLDLEEGDTKAAMVSAGWCPGDIGRVCETFGAVGMRYYLGKFKADPSASNAHRDCPSYGCSLRTPAEPRHGSPGCTCPGMMSFEEESLIDIYERGCIPCFTIGRLPDGGLGIALVACRIDDEGQRDAAHHYVALSHVWSEGMGNPHSNALPFCQLSMAQQAASMAYQIVGQKGQEDEEDEGDEETADQVHIKTKVKPVAINVWIDTMCCPATPGYGKNLCLARMREIYANAFAVVVKSQVIMSTSMGPTIRDRSRGVTDMAARIALSPWMRRMWTLQEGVLAGTSRPGPGIGERLCFAFADGLLSLEAVILLLKKAPPREVRVAWRFMAEFRGLSPTLWRLDEEEDERSDGVVVAAVTTHPRRHRLFLAMLANALKYRSLTVASDEVVCLATLLGLRIRGRPGEAEPLIGEGETPDDGMCELWRRAEEVQGGLPSDVIFSCVPRVRTAGFRWAPRTLVQYAKYGDLRVSHSSLFPARIARDEGLCVRFPGARLACLGGLETVGRMLAARFAGVDAGDDEDRPPRILSVKMLGRWYGIRVHGNGDGPGDDDAGGDGDEEMQQRSGPGPRPSKGGIDDDHGDLAQLLRNGRLALIFSPGDMITGRGLLASFTPGVSVPHADPDMAPSHEDRPLRVRSRFPVLIMPLADSACVMAESAQTCIAELHRATVAEARHRGEHVAVSNVWDGGGEIMEHMLDQTAERLIQSTSGLKEALCFEVLRKKASVTQQEARHLFKAHVRRLAYFGGGYVGDVYKEDQEWYVD
ncbi:Oxidoreductase andH [Colletotrichum sidae]|uniref:Oxidoreductase andH n=1 Tax=Colletotrichum sidae TaxID=1347389 RepID=A0A4R8T6P8_9PEZI|nr:Oxidoreductase andH [Colletotrichum sidae]